jgi:hypothetical protein
MVAGFGIVQVLHLATLRIRKRNTQGRPWLQCSKKCWRSGTQKPSVRVTLTLTWMKYGTSALPLFKLDSTNSNLSRLTTHCYQNRIQSDQPTDRRIRMASDDETTSDDDSATTRNRPANQPPNNHQPRPAPKNNLAWPTH